MSWDLFVQDIPEGAGAAADIPDDFVPRPLGTRAEIVQRITEIIPLADFSEPSLGTIDGPGFSVEISISDDEEVQSFTLHVRGGEAAAGLEESG